MFELVLNCAPLEKEISVSSAPHLKVINLLKARCSFRFIQTLSIIVILETW